MLARVIIPGTLLLLTACAAAMPGYTPPSFKEKSKFGTALESGDVQQDGRYEMSSTEKAMDCKRLSGSMQITISRLRDSHIRAEPSATAAATQKMAAPVFGGSAIGADRQAVYARERAKLDAYNRELSAKGCKTVDIEAELKRPADPPGKRY
jgi:hypothetical protein